MVSIKLTRATNVSSKKAQVFTFDYIIGLVMFIIISVIAGKQLVNILPETSYNDLYDENIYFSSTLIQPGYPNDWTPGNVLIPGIASSNRLDDVKLENLNNYTYDEIKSYFHVINEHVFYFKKNNSIITINGDCMYGYPITTNVTSCEPVFDTLGYANLVRSSRILIYNGTIIEMELYSWN